MEKAKKTILLIEDDPVTALNESDLLRDNGFETITVSNGRGAVTAVQNSEIDLVLVDIDVGSGAMSGRETAEKILEKKDLPIVFLTSHTEKTMVDKVKGITKYGYVLKNAGEIVLLHCIDMALELFEAHQKETEAVEKLQAELEGNKKIRERLEQSENLLNSLIEQSPFPTWISNDKGVLIRLNDASRELFGVTDDRGVVGRYDFHKDDILIERGLVPQFEEVYTKGKTLQLTIDYDYRKVTHVDVPEATHKILDCTVFPIKDSEGKVTNAVFQQKDITEQKIAENQLEEREKRLQETIKNLKMILDSIPEDIYISDMDTYEVLLMNRHMRESFGGDFVGEICYRAFRGEDKPCRHCTNRELVDEEKGAAGIATWEDYNPVNGKWYLNYDRAVPWVDGRLVRLQIAADITERKQFEESQQKNIEEKEAFMQELNHRVKNNLMMITALVSMKNRELGDDVDLSDLEHQIAAIRIVHEKLYQTGNITRIDFKTYSQDLLSTIFTAYPAGSVTVENKSESIFLPTKLAIPLGLILNELATNAVKHGFTADAPARFAIELRSFLSEGNAKGRYVLTVSNNGRPFPEKVDPKKADSMGLRLITVLTEQIQGTIELQKEPHPTFTIRFPSTV
jgi:two-component system, sensor histidine kinase PdtaS